MQQQLSKYFFILEVGKINNRSNQFSVREDLAALIPSSLAKQYGLFPYKLEGNKLFVAMEDPYNFIAIDHIKRITGFEIIPSQVSKKTINHHINQLYRNEPIEKALQEFKNQYTASQPQSNFTDYAAESTNSSPIVKLVDSLIKQAIEERASDIHIEPMENSIRIRFRIDGILHNIVNLPLETHSHIITRLKILGNMDIGEKRLPQDGRFEMEIMGRNIDIRVSTINTIYGEKCVLRLLDRNYFLFPKEALGFSKENMKKFNKFLKLTHGVILVTGPTGSGKSSTLYTMLNEINDEKDNIVTIEDPVECRIPGINQIQINPKAGITFSNSLRSVLRQDPDVIMLGEIRDHETAEMVIRAAITGHLVLSTVHTYNAIGTISRLLDMGVKNYLLADALAGIISQRLIRKVCPHCRKAYKPDDNDLKRIGISPKERGQWFKRVGCIKCNYTGYKGRTAVHEVLPVDKEIRRLILEGASSEAINNYAINNGFVSLREACIQAFKEGITTYEEIIHILHTFE